MESKHLASSNCQILKEDEVEIVDTETNEGRGEVLFGDMIWVKLHGQSWWPAQVVDETSVSVSNKHSKRSVGDVLVRLYGSYNFLYVDPMKYQSEFEKVLDQNKGSHTEIFKKSLEQEILDTKSGRAKGKGSKSKDVIQILSSSDGRRKQEDQEMGSPNSTSVKEGSSTRPKQDGMKKKLKTNSTAKSSQKRLPDEKTPHKKVKNGIVPSESALKKKTKNPDELQNKMKPNSPSTPLRATTLWEEPQEMSARRMRVMQSLGLIAPSGSPFLRQ